MATDKYVALIIDGFVYDVTSYLSEHPGGADILRSLNGRDATQQFRDAKHPEHAYARREAFLIGEVGEESWFKWWMVPVVAVGVMYWLNKAGNGLKGVTII